MVLSRSEGWSSRSSIFLTYTSPNELKLNIGVSKRIYYENILSIVMDALVFDSGEAPKWAVLSQDWRFSAVFSGSFDQFIVCLYCLKCVQINRIYVRDVQT